MSSKQITLALVPKFSGALSFLCSSYIVQHVLRDKKRRNTPYHRLVCGLSASDMFGSFFGFFLSTWPMPEGIVWGAVGTLQTCDVAGFFNQAGNASTPIYNGSLATYYLLLICYGWKDDRIRKIEPWLHAVPLIFGWGTAIAGLSLQLLSSANWICWIAPFPKGCDATGTCLRGNNFNAYRWAFLYAEVWTSMAYVALAMFMVYRSVRAIEKRNVRYSVQRTPLESDRKRTKKVATQAMLYVGAFFITWIFGTITRLIQTIENKVYFPIIVLMALFFPLQGFFNCLIYIRPRYLKYRTQHPEKGLCYLLCKGVCSVPSKICQCCFIAHDHADMEEGKSSEKTDATINASSVQANDTSEKNHQQGTKLPPGEASCKTDDFDDDYY